MKLAALLVLLVLCSPTSHRTCNSKYEVKLNRRSNCSSSGYVEVCWSSNAGGPLKWRAVCANDNAAATTACKLLGQTSFTAVHTTRTCMDGIKLQYCPSGTTNVQQCTILQVNPQQRQIFEVICDVSPREIQSCLSSYSSSTQPILSPSASLQNTSTPIMQQCSSSSASTETSQCPSSISGTQGVLIAGLLGAVSGILATALVGLLVGWICYHRHPKNQQSIEHCSDSSHNNPIYETITIPSTTSKNYQQALPITVGGEEENTGPVYHVLEGPNRHSQFSHKQQEWCDDYDILSEGITGLSHEVMPMQRMIEDIKEDDYQEPQDYLRNGYHRAAHNHSLVNNFTPQNCTVPETETQRA